MAKIKACPVARMIRAGRIAPGTVQRAMHANWQLAVVSILSLNRDGMFYNDLLARSGLTARTLSSVLKELVSEDLVTRTVVTTAPIRVRYAVTKTCSELLGVGCPLIEVASSHA